MADIIYIGSPKGGVGKSCVSHLLGHGLGSGLGTGRRKVIVPAAVAITDAGNPIPAQAGRRYLIVDGRNSKAFADNVVPLGDIKRTVLIIDGGANRPDLDELGQSAGLMIIPITWTDTALVMSLEALKRFPKAVGLPNGWPKEDTPKWDRNADLAALLPKHRLLPPLPSVAKVDVIARDGWYNTYATDYTKPGRDLAANVLERMGKKPEDYQLQPSA
jgi:hypothetical protein